MSKEDDIKFDGNELDDMDLSFDNLDMEAEQQPDNRDPVTQLKRNFFDGAVTKVTDRHTLEKEFKKAVPQGYSAAVDNAAKGLSEVDKVKRNLITPIRRELPEFKRNLNRLSPMVKRIVGDRFGNKFDELTKVKPKDAEIDPDQLEMRQSMAEIFGTWRESQLADRQQDVADKMMDAKTTEERFRLTYGMTTNISNSLNRLTSFNEGVLLKVHERSLELDFKKYHLLKGLLKVTTEGYNSSISELKAITKNTGLPEIIKRRNSENFKQLFLDEWQGRTTESMVDFGRDYFKRMGENLQKKATETGQQIADGLSAIGDAAGQYADMDEMQQELGGQPATLRETLLSNAGKGLGGSIAGKVLGYASDRTRQYMEKNPNAKRGDLWLRYLVGNKAQLTDNFIDERMDKEGAEGAFFRFLDSIRPKAESDRESINHSLAEKATYEAQWDRMSRETLVKIIPDWLSKIHHVLKQFVFGPDAEKETYDIFSERITTESKALKSLEKRLISNENITDVRENVAEIITALFEGNEKTKDNLTQEQMDALEIAILRSANNDIGTDFDKFARADAYNAIQGVSNEDAEALAKALSVVFSSSGKTKFSINDFSDRGSEANKRLGLLGKFNKLKGANPETQSTFNLLNATGNNQLAELLGYTERDEEGRLKLNHTNLYKRKLGRFGSEVEMDEDSLRTVRSSLTDYRDRLNDRMNSGELNDDVVEELTIEIMDVNEGIKRIDSSLSSTDGINVKLSEDNLNALHKLVSGATKQSAGTVGGEGVPINDTEIVSQLNIANATLNDVRGVLAEMYAAQQANHSESMGRTNFTSFVGNMGVKFSKLLKAPFKLVTGAVGKARKMAKAAFGTARKLATTPLNLVRGIASEVSNQLRNPDDIYVKGESEPALLGKDIKRGIYFNVGKRGRITGKPIKSIDDIKGAVKNSETGNFVITKREFGKGLETRNPGFIRKVGGLLGKGMMIPFKTAKFGFDMAAKFGKGVLSAGKGAVNFITDKLNSFKSLFDVDGNLLVSKEDLEAGLFYTIQNGKRVTVKSMKDLKDTVYSYKDGEPVITKEQLQQGLRDKFGKLIEFKSLLGTAGNKALGAAKIAGKVLMSPIKMIGKSTKALMRLFEGKLISSLLVHVPDNVIFKAQTVNLFAETINPMGKGGKKPNGKGPTRPDFSKDKPKLNFNRVKDTVSEYSKDFTGRIKKRRGEKTFDEPSKAIRKKLDELKAAVTKRKKPIPFAEKVKDAMEAEKVKQKALAGWAKLSKRNKGGDSDGDGLRDGGWKEQLRDRAKKLTTGKAKDKEGKVDAGSNKIVKTLMMLVSPIVALLGKIANIDIFKGLSKAARGLGMGSMIGDVADAIPDVDRSRNRGPRTGRMGKGRLLSRTGKALGTAVNYTKGGAGKLLAKSGVKKAAGAVAAYGAKKLAGAAVVGGLAATGFAVIAPIVGIGLAVWTAYEIGSGLWGYFSRRSDIKRIEYLRMLQYGYYVGDDGDYEDRKVALRYFENEMLDKIKPIDGVAQIAMSTEEVWEEYCGDFDSTYGDAAAREEFTRWYEYRFKPVFFKWISVVAALNKQGDDEHAMGSLDETLKKEQFPDFCKAVMDYSGGDGDPLERSPSCFTKTPVQAKRKQIQAYVDKSILKLDPKKVQGETVLGKDGKAKLAMAPALTSTNPSLVKESLKKSSNRRKGRTWLNHTGDNRGATNTMGYGLVRHISGITEEPKNLVRSVIKHLINSDDRTLESFVPVVNKIVRGLDSNKDELIVEVRRDIHNLIDVGSHGDVLNNWLTKTLFPLMRVLVQQVGVTDGYFNEIDPEDYDALHKAILNYTRRGSGDAALNIANGKLITRTVEKSRTVTRTSTKTHISDVTKNNSTLRIADRVRLRKERIAKLRAKHNTSLFNKPSTSKRGGEYDLSNKVEIEPITMGSEVSNGEPAPHKITDKVEERIAKYNQYIYEASAVTGVDENLIRAVIRQESSGNPKAKSPVGAAGLMQLMPATARELGVTNRLDPKQSIMGGSEYIRRQLKRFDGVPELALAAYNAGGGNINKAIRKAGTKDPQAVLNTLPQVTGRHSKETQEYVVKITNDYRKRKGIKGESEYVESEGQKQNAVSISPAMATVPKSNRSNPSGLPSTTNVNATATNTSDTNQPDDAMDVVSRVVAQKREANAQTRSIMDANFESVNLASEQLININYDQLVELKVLNQQMTTLIKTVTPNTEEPTNYESKREEKELYAKAEEAVSKPKRFNRRVVSSTPPVSLERKIS